MSKSTNLRLFTMAVAALFSVSAAMAFKNPEPKQNPMYGRWDLTVTVDGKEIPSWIEVHKSGDHRLVGYFVGAGGSARPISKVNYDNGKFSFTIPPQWEREDNDITVTGELVGDSIVGTLLEANGSTHNWHGHRAPDLRRTAAPVWGKPIDLLKGNLDSWTATGENQWKLVNSILTSEHKGANLVTKQTFNDFKLHVEFRLPDTSNSGVYLRGRYEVQVIGNAWNEPPKNGFSGVYGFIEPTENTSKPAGQWQTFDITLIGRLVTVVANGKTVVCSQVIPGITGGALDSHEELPGPIYIQGDHGPVEYKSIVITPAKQE